MALGPEYATKTISELQAEFADLGSQIGVLYPKRQEIADLIEQRKADAKAAAHISLLTEIEKDALKRALESRVLNPE